MKDFLFSLLFLGIGLSVLICSGHNWMTAFELIAYTGIGLGLMIITRSIFLESKKEM